MESCGVVMPACTEKRWRAVSSVCPRRQVPRILLGLALHGVTGIKKGVGSHLLRWFRWWHVAGANRLAGVKVAQMPAFSMIRRLEIAILTDVWPTRFDGAGECPNFRPWGALPQWRVGKPYVAMGARCGKCSKPGFLLKDNPDVFMGLLDLRYGHWQISF